MKSSSYVLPATLMPAVACCLVTFAAAAGAQRPASLVRNGGCEQSSAWTFADSGFAEGGNPGRCLRIVGTGAATQDVLVARQTLTLTVAVDVLANGVKAHEGKPGYAFAAVYQTDETGRLLANHDFIQITGTQDWQRRSYTFRVDPGADYVSLRCGLFQAGGEVRFDNWTLVPGSEAKRLDEVTEPANHPPRPGVAAILNQPDLPAQAPFFAADDRRGAERGGTGNAPALGRRVGGPNAAQHVAIRLACLADGADIPGGGSLGDHRVPAARRQFCLHGRLHFQSSGRQGRWPVDGRTADCPAANR